MIDISKQDKDIKFILDKRLSSCSFELIDWPLSSVRLKNNSIYPWIILIPRRVDVSEITDLSQSDLHQLMNEIQKASSIIQEIFNPDKMNFGSLGNIVNQFHTHVIARFCNDPLWPHSVWQSALKETPYEKPNDLITCLTTKLSLVEF